MWRAHRENDMGAPYFLPIDPVERRLDMKKLLVVTLLAALAAPLSGCYIAPVGPGYARPVAVAPVWIPGHFGPYGRWIPGHYA